MRFALIGIGMSVGVVMIGLGACSSSTATRLGANGSGGNGGDDTSGNGNGNVTSTGSSQMCGTLVGPNVSAQCTQCNGAAVGTTGSLTSGSLSSGSQSTGSFNSGVGGNSGSSQVSGTSGTGGVFAGTTVSQGSGGLTCQPNGCVQGLWCDTVALICQMQPVCNTSTTGSNVGGAGPGVTTNNGVGPGPDSSVSSTGTGGSCAHDPCVAGVALVIGCSACSQIVCSSDSFCCTTTWDSNCVSEATNMCGTCAVGTSSVSSSQASTGSGACTLSGQSCINDVECCSDFCDGGFCD